MHDFFQPDAHKLFPKWSRFLCHLAVKFLHLSVSQSLTIITDMAEDTRLL